VPPAKKAQVHSMTSRSYSRSPDALRPFVLDDQIPGAAAGRVLVKAGRTAVLCTASVDLQVASWLTGQGKGWITAEYNMLPGSTAPRKPRERSNKLDGRTSEIQRLIGRSLRAVMDLSALGEKTVTVDCDVLEADGGTRTASITGGYVALVRALRSLPEFQSGPLPLVDSVAAVSVGLVDGVPLLDLDYDEDVGAAVDMNVVMTGSGRFVEIQGTGEEATFSRAEMDALVELAEHGIGQLSQLQREFLGAK